jgi:hypothetical protein
MVSPVIPQNFCTSSVAPVPGNPPRDSSSAGEPNALNVIDNELVLPY